MPEYFTDENVQSVKKALSSIEIAAERFFNLKRGKTDDFEKQAILLDDDSGERNLYDNVEQLQKTLEESLTLINAYKLGGEALSTVKMVIWKDNVREKIAAGRAKKQKTRERNAAKKAAKEEAKKNGEKVAPKKPGRKRKASNNIEDENPKKKQKTEQETKTDEDEEEEKEHEEEEEEEETDGEGGLLLSLKN
jgi:hypothetical protein